MFRRIFPRLLVAYLAGTVIIVLVLSTLLQQLLYSYFYREQEAMLLERARRVQSFAQQFHLGEVTRREWIRLLITIDQTTNARIMVLGPAGLMDSRPQQPPSIDRDVLADLMRQLEQGKIASVLSSPHLSRSRGAILSVAVPLDPDGDPAGVILLQKQVADLRQPLGKLRRLVWFAAGIALLVAVPILYLISQRISAPLRAIHQGALSLAEGDFSRRVPEGEGDEVGELGAAFNYMASRLEALERTRRDFLATVSHELRTPLTSIRGFVQGLLDGTIPAGSQKPYLGRVFDEVQRLTGLVEELLDLARIQAGQLELELDTVDLSEAARESLSRLEPQTAARKLEVVVQDPEDPVLVQADPDRLHQVILNLLDNAIKFSMEGGKVEVGIKSAGHFGVLTVADSGPGIPASELPHIWDRFYKADRARASGKGGSGLGLTIVRHLVEAHGGKVEVQSIAGKGSAFSVWLPLATDSKA